MKITLVSKAILESTDGGKDVEVSPSDKPAILYHGHTPDWCIAVEYAGRKYAANPQAFKEFR